MTLEYDDPIDAETDDASVSSYTAMDLDHHVDIVMSEHQRVFAGPDPQPDMADSSRVEKMPFTAVSYSRLADPPHTKLLMPDLHHIAQLDHKANAADYQRLGSSDPEIGMPECQLNGLDTNGAMFDGRLADLDIKLGMSDGCLTDQDPKRDISNDRLTYSEPNLSNKLGMPDGRLPDPDTKLGVPERRLTVTDINKLGMPNCRIIDPDTKLGVLECRLTDTDINKLGVTHGRLTDTDHKLEVPDSQVTKIDMPDSQPVDDLERKVIIPKCRLADADPEAGQLDAALLPTITPSASDVNSDCTTWSLSTDRKSGGNGPGPNTSHVNRSPNSQALSILCISGALLNPLFGPVVLYYTYRMKKSQQRRQYSAAYHYSCIATGVALIGIFVTITALVFVGVLAATRTRAHACKQNDVAGSAAPLSFSVFRNSDEGTRTRNGSVSVSVFRDISQDNQDDCFSSHPHNETFVKVGGHSDAPSKHINGMNMAPPGQLVKRIVNATYFILYFPETEECKHVLL